MLYDLIDATFRFVRNTYTYFGIAGSLVVLFVVFSSGLVYRGKQMEHYSVFNHFISELGEIGVSRWARVFNGGLIAVGVLLMPFIAGLTFRLGNLWAFLGGAAGLVTAIACALVGVFPMNDLPSHTKAAMTFFRAGLVMILFYSLAIATQTAETRDVPMVGMALSLLGLAAFVSFLILVRGSNVSNQVEDVLNPQKQAQRPRY